MQASTKSGKRALVVDDDPAVCDLLACMLTEQGLDVDTAGSADEAMFLFEERRYALVTLDFCMPDMDGLEFQRELSRLYGLGQGPPLLPGRLPATVVISGFLTDDLVQEWLACEEVVAVMSKPIRYAEFMANVERALSRAPVDDAEDLDPEATLYLARRAG